MATGNYSNVRVLVRGAYDIQKLRIQMGNRICQNFRHKLGISSSQPEEEMDNVAKEVMKKLRASHEKLASAVAKMSSKNFEGDEIISTYTEFVLVAEYLELEMVEESHFSRLGKILEEIPIYKHFLKGIKGIGPAMAGVIVSELDPHKAKHPSSFVKYAGLDVAPDGKGRSRRKEHLVKREYVNSAGEKAERDGITFNAFLKTKLIGVLGGSFLKSKSSYADVYYNTKHRLENHAIYKDVSKGHRHNMAVRKMIVIFLIDLHIKWRELEGLPVSVPYCEAKLGLKHGAPVDQATARNSDDAIAA